jgi:UDP-N-acetylmuramate: L-alanyl-gamma-D-glutamyl-meso-diaminopimelate ligase
VVGNAISRGHAQAEWLLDTGAVPFVSLPEFLFQNFLRGRRRIVVCGTHGKTTTCAAGAHYLCQLGCAPGYFIGGAPHNFPSGAALGRTSAPFIIEGDEYDSAFFDKRSKFIHYAPNVLVMNGIDFDHADIFRDLADVLRTFSHLLRTVPCSGRVFYNGDDPNARGVCLPCTWTNFSAVGFGEDCDFRLQNLRSRGPGSEWELHHGAGVLRLCSSLFGVYNARNISMAILAAHCALGTPLPDSIDFTSFQGVRRRQQVLAERPNLVVYEDFGHHPRAVSEVLCSLRERHPGSELIACFEPASHTSMRRVLQGEFSSAFSLADRCYWGAPRRPEAIPPGERLCVEEVLAPLRSLGRDARAFERNAELQGHLEDLLARPAGQRVLVLFSNGAFPGVLDHWRAHETGDTRP